MAISWCLVGSEYCDCGANHCLSVQLNSMLLYLHMKICLLVSFPDAEQLWVLDSVPGEVSSENSDGEVEKVLETLQSLPSLLPSRR